MALCQCVMAGMASPDKTILQTKELPMKSSDLEGGPIDPTHLLRTQIGLDDNWESSENKKLLFQNVSKPRHDLLDESAGGTLSVV